MLTIPQNTNRCAILILEVLTVLDFLKGMTLQLLFFVTEFTQFTCLHTMNHIVY